MAASKKILTDLDFQGVSRLVGIPVPLSDNEAANKAYVDAAIEGITWKSNVRVASTGNVNINVPGTSSDGVTLALADRYLLKDQTNASENGLYVFNGAATALTRAADGSSFSELEAAVVTIEEGTANGGAQFRQTQVGGTIDTDDIIFETFAPNTPNATDTTRGIIEIATQAEVDAGTDTEKAVTPATLRNSNLLLAKHAETFGDTSNTQYTIAHNLDTEDVVVTIREATADKAEVLVDVQVIDANSIRVCTAVAPGTNSLRAVVIG